MELWLSHVTRLSKPAARHGGGRLFPAGKDGATAERFRVGPFSRGGSIAPELFRDGAPTRTRTGRGGIGSVVVTTHLHSASVWIRIRKLCVGGQRVVPA